MAVAATIGVNIVAKVDDFQSALSGLSSKLQNTGKELSELGASMTTNLTLPILGLGAAVGAAVVKASDLEEAQSAVNQIFGEAGPIIQEFAEGAASSLGLAQEEALNAAKQFGIFGQAAGLSGDDLVAFTSDLTVLATDLASFNNTTVDQAIQALGAALRGESEPIRQYGVLLDDATLKAEALERGIIATTKDALTPQQRVLAATGVIFEQTAKQQGDFERTADGLANTQKILAAEFQNVTAQLGQAFLPIALELANIVSDFVVPGIQLLADVVGAIPTPFLTMATVLGGVAAAAGPVIFAVGKVITLVGMIATPVGWAVTAMVGLIGILTAAYVKFEGFRNAVQGFINGAKDLLGIKGKVELDVKANVDTAMPAQNFADLALNTSVAAAAVKDSGEAAKAAAEAAKAHQEALIAGADAGILNRQEMVELLQATSRTRQELQAGNVPLARRIELTKNLNALDEASAGILGEVQVNLQTFGVTAIKAEQVTAVMRDRLESVGQVSVSVFDRLKAVAAPFGDRLNELATNELSRLGGSAMDLFSKFTPMGLIVQVLGEAMKELEPVFEALQGPIKIVGAILGKALAPILEALFPIFKLIAIAATYVGQVFFKIAEWISKAIGYAVLSIGKAIDALPFVSAKKVIAAGQALVDIGAGFGEAYDALGDARDEIRGITLGEDEEDETTALLVDSNAKQDMIAENTSEMVGLLREQVETPRTVNVTVQVSADGGSGLPVGQQIAQALDDYFGRSVLYEERQLGRVGAF